jgi:hypothetical protein
MYCAHSRYFAGSCPMKLKAMSGQMEISPFKDSGKGKEVEDLV